MLADRLLTALEVLGSDHDVSGSLRKQASAYIGEDVDDRSVAYLGQTAITVYQGVFKLAARKLRPEDAHDLALTYVLVSGVAIGKRLGIEDGEKFAKEVGNVT